MHSRPLAGTILSLALIHSGMASAADPPKTFDVDAIDAYVAAVVREKGIPGLGLAIAKDGKIVLAKGYGKKSLEADAAVEAETPFAIGSVTKQFACAAILMLAEDGKLSIDDKVSKYFPELTKAGEITILQLMNHTSGYPDYYPLDFVDRRLAKAITVDELINEYASCKLDFDPGARWSYSNTGFMILGRVVEKVSGESLGTFLKKRIFDPAGMKTASLDPSPSEAGRPVGYLSFALGPKEPAVPESSGWLYAAGGIWASAPDLVRWDLALMEGKLLKPETFRTMTTPAVLNDGKTRDYGCGLAIGRRDGEVVFNHGGAVSGFRAYNAFIPRTKSAVAVLVNDEQSPDISRVILELLLKDEKAPAVPKIAGLSAEDAALNFFHQMQSGEIDRSKLGEEFSIYLNDARVKAAAPRLKALGEPEKVVAEGVSERGGMAVASIRMNFKKTTLRGAMYRSSDGKIQQLLFNED